MEGIESYLALVDRDYRLVSSEGGSVSGVSGLANEVEVDAYRSGVCNFGTKEVKEHDHGNS
jgi:hypothetical protein